MTPEKMERYLHADCALLARAVRELTGWSLAVVDSESDPDAREDWHVGVITPSGAFLDAAGLHDPYPYDDELDDQLVDSDWGRQPDDEVRADAAALLRELAEDLTS